jgi:hypothetical protein
MKNSAWDHKLWSDKFDQLHVKDEAASAWPEMNRLLDEQLPQDTSKSFPQRKVYKSNILFLLALVAIIIVLLLIYRNRSNDTDKSDNQLKNKSLTLADTNNQSQEQQAPEKPLSSPLITDNNAVKQKGDVQYKNRQSLSDLVSVFQDPLSSSRGKSSLNASEIATAYGAIPISAQQNLIVVNPKSKPFQEENRLNELITKNNSLSILSVQEKSYQMVTSAASYMVIDTSLGLMKSYYSEQSEKQLEQRMKVEKDKKDKQKLAKNKFRQSWISVGLMAGSSFGHTPNYFFGTDASLKIYDRIRFNSGLIFHQKRNISGNIIHPSYFRPDSIAPFSISDARKIDVLTIPLHIEIRASNSLNIKAGLLVNMLQKQYGTITKINSLPDKRDTLNQSAFVNKSLQQTQFIPAKLGLNLGVGYQYRNLNISALYVRNLKSDQVLSPLGNYSTRFQAVQLSLGYQFNLVKKGKKEKKNKKNSP